MSSFFPDAFFVSPAVVEFHEQKFVKLRENVLEVQHMENGDFYEFFY